MRYGGGADQTRSGQLVKPHPVRISRHQNQPNAEDSHLMSLLMELAFSLAASVSDWTRCRIESLVLAGLVGALMVRLLGCCCCCCWNSSRMSTDSEAGVAACDRDGLEAYCRCWARCCGCECGPAAAGGRSPTGAIDGSASSASAERSPEENLRTTDQVRRPGGSALRPVTERWGRSCFRTEFKEPSFLYTQFRNYTRRVVI